MRPRNPAFKGPQQHQWIRQWRAAMSRRDKSHGTQAVSIPAELRRLSLGDRARLRRIPTGVELAGDPAVLLLVRGLVQRTQNGMPTDSALDHYRLGLVAGVLASVDEDLDDRSGDEAATRRESRTLARRLGSGEKGAPMMSELRFRRMEQSTDPEDLLRQWRRAVQLAKRRAHVASLADDLYSWLQELDHPEHYADRSVRFHWAYDYYQQPPDSASDAQPTPDPEAAG